MDPRGGWVDEWLGMGGCLRIYHIVLIPNNIGVKEQTHILR